MTMAATFQRVPVKPEKSARLVPHIPFVISWLRNRDGRASDLFLGAAKSVDDDEVQATWKDVLDALDSYGDLTTQQWRQICSERDPAVWARAIHILFMGSEPRIVPKKISQALFKLLPKVRDPQNGAEIAVILAPELDKLKLVCLEALGELCALIRDASIDPRYTAASLGPSVFLDADEDAQFVNASRLMQLLVEHAEIIFGKSGARSRFDPLGVRRPDYQEDKKSFDTESQLSRTRNQTTRPQMTTALNEAGFL